METWNQTWELTELECELVLQIMNVAAGHYAQVSESQMRRIERLRANLEGVVGAVDSTP